MASGYSFRCSISNTSAPSSTAITRKPAPTGCFDKACVSVRRLQRRGRLWRARFTRVTEMAVHNPNAEVYERKYSFTLHGACRPFPRSSTPRCYGSSMRSVDRRKNFLSRSNAPWPNAPAAINHYLPRPIGAKHRVNARKRDGLVSSGAAWPNAWHGDSAEVFEL
jgi:hypothetical protein